MLLCRGIPGVLNLNTLPPMEYKNIDEIEIIKFIFHNVYQNVLV